MFRMSDIVVYLLLSKVHFTDLIKGQQHFSDSDCRTRLGILNHCDFKKMRVLKDRPQSIMYEINGDKLNCDD